MAKKIKTYTITITTTNWTEAVKLTLIRNLLKDNRFSLITAIQIINCLEPVE